MAKRIGGNDVESTEIEYAVEYDLNGETFVTIAEDEDEARLMRAALNGTILVREVHIMAWASLSQSNERGSR